jgi:type IV pilus assembly protein PilA
MTLIEITAVVAMIGVLAAIAIVGYRKYVDWAEVANTKDLINGLSAGQENYYAEARGYLDCSADWSPVNAYPMRPNARKHPFHNPGHPNYDCFRLLNPAVSEPTYMSFMVKADVASSNFIALPGGMARANIPNGMRDYSKPWYIIIAIGDRDEDLTDYAYYMTHSGAPTEIHVEAEDE